jgi:hypothetical protein
MNPNTTENGRSVNAHMVTQVVLVILLLVLGRIPCAAQWIFTGPEGVSETWSVSNDVQIDTSGMPVIIFYENTTYKASCLRFNGTEWVSVGGSGFSTYPAAMLLDFEIDPKNNFYVLFRDKANSLTSCIRYNGSSWESVGSQYVSPERTLYQSLAIDTAGKAYVAFYGLSGFKIVTAAENAWQQVTTAGLSLTPYQMDLRFDKSNVAYLGFCEASLNKANCAKLVSNAWETVGNTNFSPMMGLNPCLVLTANQQLYLAVTINYSTAQCYHYNPQSGNWSLAGSSGLGGSFGWIDDIASDRNANLYITTSGLAGDKARCLKFNGTNWIQLPDTGISESYAGQVKIALDKEDKMYVTYNDFFRSKAVVKAYTLSTRGDYDPVLRQVRICPNPASGCFSVQCPGLSFSMHIYDTEGRMVYRKPGVCNDEMIDVGLLRKGVYFVRILSGTRECFTEKLVIQ